VFATGTAIRSVDKRGVAQFYSKLQPQTLKDAKKKGGWMLAAEGVGCCDHGA
jgi:hypothetical protein